MKIAITGSQGLLGRTVTTHSKESGHEIIELSRSNTNYKDKAGLVKVFRNVETIIHTAGIILSRAEQQKRPADVLIKNIELDLMITDAAREAGVKQVILCGSVLAYGNATGALTEDTIGKTTLNEATKYYGHARLTTCLLAEALQKQYNFNVTCLIFPNLYGPHDKFDYQPPPLIPNALLQVAQAYNSGAKTLHGGNNGNVEIELLYTTDAAHAINTLLAKSNLPPVLNIPATNIYSIADVYTAAAKAVGFTGTITWEESNLQKVVTKQLDSKNTSAIINWQPTTELTEGIKEVWDIYQRQNINI